jgi:hypothetical protein
LRRPASASGGFTSPWKITMRAPSGGTGSASSCWARSECSST